MEQVGAIQISSLPNTRSFLLHATMLLLTVGIPHALAKVQQRWAESGAALKAAARGGCPSAVCGSAGLSRAFRGWLLEGVAGGQYVDALMAAPGAVGLFQAAISQSPPCVMLITLEQVPYRTARCVTPSETAFCCRFILERRSRSRDARFNRGQK